MGVIGRVCRLSALLIKEQTRVLAEHGLDFAGFDVLATLRRSGPPHALTPTQLAKAMLVTPSAVAQRLARLEDAGLLVRAQAQFDRRVIIVTLTDKGQELIDAVLPAHLANEQSLLADFSSEDRQVFESLLRRFLMAQDDLPI